MARPLVVPQPCALLHANHGASPICHSACSALESAWGDATANGATEKGTMWRRLMPWLLNCKCDGQTLSGLHHESHGSLRMPYKGSMSCQPVASTTPLSHVRVYTR